MRSLHFQALLAFSCGLLLFFFLYNKCANAPDQSFSTTLSSIQPRSLLFPSSVQPLSLLFPRSLSPSVADSDVLSLYGGAYEKFTADLVRLRKMMKDFCAEPVPDGWLHLGKCLTGTLESELLYLRIRLLGPSQVAEISSATGYSTLVILQALEDNGGKGELISFDMFETPFPRQLEAGVAKRWRFIKGDMQKTLPKVLEATPLDYLHVDTCHEAPCIKWYIENVLALVKPGTLGRVYLSLHDLYTCYRGIAPQAMQAEGMMVVEALVYQGRNQLAHTFCFGKSSVIDRIHEKRISILGKEEAELIIGECKKCGWDGRDYSSTLYLELM